MRLTETDMAVMRTLSVSGAATVPELERAFPVLKGCKYSLERLYSHGYVLRESPGVSKPPIWQLTAKGRRQLAPKAPAMGQMPTPRSSPPAGVYTGEKAIATRPGAMDAFDCPSRRGAELVPHRLPISMGPTQ